MTRLDIFYLNKTAFLNEMDEDKYGFAAGVKTKSRIGTNADPKDLYGDKYRVPG